MVALRASLLVAGVPLVLGCAHVFVSSVSPSDAVSAATECGGVDRPAVTVASVTRGPAGDFTASGSELDPERLVWAVEFSEPSHPRDAFCRPELGADLDPCRQLTTGLLMLVDATTGECIEGYSLPLLHP